MSADIYTKGFQNRLLFRRLRQLINIYSPEEITGCRWNPPVLNNDGSPKPRCEGDTLNTQYEVITSGANSKTKIKRAIKVKAKSKPKISKMMKRTPTAVTEAYVADAVGLDLDKVNWFLRVDYGATNYVVSNEDPRCPDWKTVSWRRTYNVRNGWKKKVRAAMKKLPNS